VHTIDRLAFVNTGLLLLRLVLAAVFMFHGAQKLFGAFGGKGMEGFIAGLESMGAPMPTASAWAAACAEFFGGLVLVVGNGTRIAAALIAFTMVVAILLVHNKAFSL
jgi:putative oxidoreductase